MIIDTHTLNQLFSNSPIGHCILANMNLRTWKSFDRWSWSLALTLTVVSIRSAIVCTCRVGRRVLRHLSIVGRWSVGLAVVLRVSSVPRIVCWIRRSTEMKEEHQFPKVIGNIDSLTYSPDNRCSRYDHSLAVERSSRALYCCCKTGHTHCSCSRSAGACCCYNRCADTDPCIGSNDLDTSHHVWNGKLLAVDS